MKILIAAAAVPAPDRKGYQVRLYHQVVGLAGRHAITLVTLASDDTPVPGAIRDACHGLHLVPIAPAGKAAAAARYGLRLPLTVAYLQTVAMQRRLASLVAESSFDVAHIQLIRMSPYRSQTASLPRVIDLVDALSLNMRERARISAPWLRPALRVEAERLRRYERKEIPHYQRALVVAERDRAALGQPNILVNPMGVEVPPTLLDRGRTGLVFTGNMGYFANQDAATWFIKEILPSIRKAEPAAKVAIVGRRPSSRLQTLARSQGVSVTGEVASMDEPLAGAAMAVCPMRLGSGIPTKILEALAAGTPVVATSKATQGLPDDLRPMVVTADTPEAFAREVIRVLRNPAEGQAMARRGRDLLQARYSWRHSVEQLERSYQEAVQI